MIGYKLVNMTVMIAGQLGEMAKSDEDEDADEEECWLLGCCEDEVMRSQAEVLTPGPLSTLKRIEMTPLSLKIIRMFNHLT